MVHLIEIHVVRAQARKRCVDGMQHVLSRSAPLPVKRPHIETALGGEDKLFALSAEPPADDFFGASDQFQRAPQRVNIRGVDEGHAALRRPVENGNGGRLVALQSKGHGAQTEF